jgi:hypothetical protein
MSQVYTHLTRGGWNGGQFTDLVEPKHPLLSNVARGKITGITVDLSVNGLSSAVVTNIRV